MTHTNSKTRTFARDLRSNPTPAETRLWQVLRKHQIQDARFRRQHLIGPYIVDFCAPRLKLVIEVDGGQHIDQHEYDCQRTAFLESKGYRVLRFWNNEVEDDLNAVAQVITETIAQIYKGS
jgi:very-short-patch-repair endonuclease